MSINLMDLVKENLTDGVMDQLSSLIGENKSTTSSAIGKFLPALMGGVAQKGSTESGAGSLLKLITDNGLGADTLGSLGSVLMGGDKSSAFLKMGGSLLSSILGSNQDSMLGKLISLTGLGRKSSSSLMGFLAPIVMGQIGKIVKNKGLNALGLKNLLGEQKGYIAKAMPVGLGLASSAASGSNQASSNDGGGGMGWLKYLLPLLLLLAALWYFLRGGSDDTTDATSSTNTELTSSESHHGHSHDGHSHDGHTHTHADGTVHHGEAHGDATNNTINSSMDKTNQVVGDIKDAVTYSVDAAGNLVSSTGEVMAKKGEFSIKDGMYLDADGNELNFMQKLGNAAKGAAGAVGDAGKAVGGAVGDAGKAVGGAVAGAAGKTKDAFVGLFSGMFSDKAKTGSTYGLHDIEFNKENHRITNFSKSEVEGLAAALSTNPNSKIQVQVHSADGKDGGDNKKLSKIRAEVVRDMLVTLGVDKGQISFKGMGSDDAGKAAANAVEIMVEQ